MSNSLYVTLYKWVGFHPLYIITWKSLPPIEKYSQYKEPLYNGCIIPVSGWCSTPNQLQPFARYLMGKMAHLGCKNECSSLLMNAHHLFFLIPKILKIEKGMLNPYLWKHPYTVHIPKGFSTKEQPPRGSPPHRSLRLDH